MYAKYYAVTKLKYVIGDKPFICSSGSNKSLDGIYISKILT